MGEKNLKQIVRAMENFQIPGRIMSCIPYGNGHINDTFLIVAEEETKAVHRYILQGINHTIFKKPDEVMENIVAVTDFLRKSATDSRQVLHVIPTYNENSYYKDQDGNYWRVYDFIEDSICLEKVETKEDFYQCAYAFGKFQRDLSVFPAECLHETIPNFHNTPKRFQDFLKAVEEDKMGRAKEVETEIQFIKARSDFYSVLYENHAAGKLPLRVSHNDTKINNVMLDANTREVLCVIDLDTIMPGFSVTDFGDSIRFGANTGAEDEKDLSKVNLDVELFRVYTKGFLEGCGGQLPDSEIMLFPEGAKMMTIENAMRFLADYLEGDVYYKIHYPEQNLDRSRTQIKLVEDMEQHWDELKSIVKSYCKG